MASEWKVPTCEIGNGISAYDKRQVQMYEEKVSRYILRLETEVEKLRAKLAAAEKRIEKQAECLVLLTEEIWTGDELDAVLDAVTGAVELLKERD